MELKPIKTKADYQAALKLAERLWDAPAGSRDGDRLDVLTLLIQDYESRHFPMPDPDPIDFAFARECRRQSLLIANRREEVQDFLDQANEEIEGWTS